jgi:signal transduction histidine kinase
MPRLFRKFFTTIWLTLAIPLLAVIPLVNGFQGPPSPPGAERQKRELVLDLTRNLLATDGLEAAERFIRVSEATSPLGLVIASGEDLATCDAKKTEDSRTLEKDGVCYRIVLSRQSELRPPYLGLLMPWLGILLSSTLAAALLARYLIRPVVHLRDGLSALANGRFDVRIGDKMAGRRDEVTALAHDFDVSAARLQEFQDAQRRLFHDVSHELRSPLSRLQAAVGVLRQSPAKIDAMLDRMDREVERLDVLVGEVLTLARLTAGSNLPLKTQAVDVVDLLNEVLSDAAFEAQARGVSITTDIDGAFLAPVDGELVYRALENVIRNAVKYTAEGSRVTVSIEIAANLLTVRISDEGPGVGRDELERIFQPFSRGSDTVLVGGYGLGLAIARQAIERHGGRVFASSVYAGGLIVTIELPAGPTA